jgi:hypothetical protein
MRRHRTTARALLFLLLLGASSGTAQAAVPSVIAFPVVGNVSFIDDYGAPRWSGWHQGNDIMARRHAPAIALEAGRVDIHHRSLKSTCMIYLHAVSGMTYVYIHLNNDLTMRNDNRGGCRAGVAYARGLRDGQRVRRGQLLGYVGDSGDADGISPHLHFEIRRAGRSPTNPYRHLLRAKRLLFPGPAQSGGLSLVLWGRVRSVSGDRVQIRTTNVWMTNGWRFVLARYVTFALPPDLVVERRTKSGIAAAQLPEVAPGDLVTVRTKPFTPTWATQLAAAGVLSAQRLRLH